MVFPLYDSIKLTWDAVGSWFPHLKDKLRLPAEGAKAVSSLTRIGTLARKMPIRGILIPELPSSHEALDSIFCEKISASAAMLAIAPTTLMHLPEDRPQSWARFRAAAESSSNLSLGVEFNPAIESNALSASSRIEAVGGRSHYARIQPGA